MSGVIVIRPRVARADSQVVIFMSIEEARDLLEDNLPLKPIADALGVESWRSLDSSDPG